MRTEGHPGEPLLYERIASEIGELIERGTFRAGERVPSVRALARQRRVSVNTVLEAYAQLENRRLIEARPQSGYYVVPRLAEPDPPAGAAPEGLVPTPVVVGRGPLEVMRALADPGLVPLARGGANVALLPAERLARMLASEARRFRDEGIGYADRRGLRRLRIQLARRALDAGCRLGPDDVVVTSGCVEALTLALQATCKPGDTVAVGAPVYYSFLHSIQWLGLKVLEIPMSARDGLSLEVLAYALRHHPVRACLAIANFANPLGCRMSDAHKRELVRLLARHDVPLIDDDVYGELGFAAHRPCATQAFDDRGLVLHCASFSKTLAPGYRVGWIAPGRYREKVEGLKGVLASATASPTQLAVAEFLVSGGYDRHLRTLRRTYARQVAEMRAAVARAFPPGTRVTRPEGGFVLWVELPEGADALKVHEAALRRRIGVAPGTLFTTGSGFRSCLRLSASIWDDRVAQAVRTVGELAGEVVQSPRRSRRR